MRWLPRPAWPLVGLAALGGVGLVTTALDGVRTPGPFGVAQPLVWALLGLLPAYLSGLLLVWLRPAERIPSLLLAMASSMAVATALGAVTSHLQDDDRARSWWWLLVMAEYVFDLAGPAAMGAMFATFPDGRVGSARGRRVIGGIGCLVATLPVLLALSHPLLPAPVYAASRAASVPSPLAVGWLQPAGPVVEAAYHLAAQLGLVGAVLLVVRYRWMSRERRRQTSWLALAALVVVGDAIVIQLLAAYGVLSPSVQLSTFYAIWVPALVCIPTAILVALLRHHLFDVHLVVRRSALYGVVSALIGTAYLGVAGALGITAGRQLPLVATVAVTIAVVLALHPVRRTLNRWADRWAYGERPSGTALLSQFGETLEHAYDLHELAPRAAAGVAEGLGLRWARLSLRLPGSSLTEPLGSAGIALTDPAEPQEVVPLVDRDETVGQIECGPRLRGGPLGRQDRELLQTVARQTALAVRNAHFAVELASQVAEIRRQAAALDDSRHRLVDAQDSERHRLERDLHDGVQQQIVVIMTQLRLAQNQLGRDPAAARRALEDAQRSAADTLVELRELAQGIRPPVLADRGLLAAVTSRVSRIPVGVEIHAGPRMSEARFPADVEAAAYFLVSEGLVNALKHAQAARIRVGLHVDGDLLSVEVSDDGVGFVPSDAEGTGLTGLADRVGAVGGRLQVRSRPGHGARLMAQLPGRRPADV